MAEETPFGCHGIRIIPTREPGFQRSLETLDFRNSSSLVAYTHGRGAFLAGLELCPSCLVRDGDLTNDGEVNLADYAVFAECANGPGGAAAPPFCDPCDFANSDLDADGDVDLQDFGLMQVYFTGASQ